MFLDQNIFYDLLVESLWFEENVYSKMPATLFKLLISTFKLDYPLRTVIYTIPTLGNLFCFIFTVKYMIYICECSMRSWKEVYYLFFPEIIMRILN